MTKAEVLQIIKEYEAQRDAARAQAGPSDWSKAARAWAESRNPPALFQSWEIMHKSKIWIFLYLSLDIFISIPPKIFLALCFSLWYSK